MGNFNLLWSSSKLNQIYVTSFHQWESASQQGGAAAGWGHAIHGPVWVPPAC